MRSFSFTLILVVVAALICGVIGWQLREGNLNVLFGVPPIPPGQRLYTNFQPGEVGRITVSAHSLKADFIKTADGWKSATPPQDRMDPRFAVWIIDFTLGLNVQDFAPTDEMNMEEAGLRQDAVQITLETAAGTQLARYRMGDRTPLLSEIKDSTKPVATFFIQVRERGRKDFVYACTGDISELFRDGMKYFRDHRPFYFNPQLLQKIRLRGAEGELTLGHEEPKSPWRIIKPIELHTDPAAVKTLLEGLFELRSLRVADRSSVTLPESSSKTLQIGLTQFGGETETLLEVFPPETPNSREALATVSNRPDTVFYLPIRPEPSFRPLADLPVTVNELRDPTLTNLNIASLRAISISPATGKKILITREPPKPWQVEIDGKVREANEQRLFALLKALTTGRAIGFESDAATDFTPWGLNKPFLKIELLGENNEGLQLNFGMDGRGGVFVNRQGTPTVMRVDPALLAAVSIQPYEWRHARLWSVSTVDLVAIERIVRADPALVLGYSFNDEKWDAELEGVNISDRLDPAKANRMLDALVGLNVTRWLAPDDADAAAALVAPLLTLTVVEKTVNDVGDTTGIEGREINFAPVPGDPKMFYGRLHDEPNPFLLDRDTFLKIGLDPLEKK
jgi:hypothetical protein